MIALAYPLLFALAPVAAYNLEPRYLYPLSAIIALLAGVALARHTIARRRCVRCGAGALGHRAPSARRREPRRGGDRRCCGAGGCRAGDRRAPGSGCTLRTRVVLDRLPPDVRERRARSLSPPPARCDTSRTSAKCMSSADACTRLRRGRIRRAGRPKDLERKGYRRLERGGWIVYLARHRERRADPAQRVACVACAGSADCSRRPAPGRRTVPPSTRCSTRSGTAARTTAPRRRSARACSAIAACA